MGTLGPLCWPAACVEPPCVEPTCAGSCALQLRPCGRRDRALFLPNPELDASRSSDAGTRDRRCNNTVITAGSHHHFPSDVEEGGANGVGCEGRGQEVCRVLLFSPLCPGLEPASMLGILPFWISVCAVFILTSCEEQRIPEGEWVSAVLRTVPGSHDPRPGLCWIEFGCYKVVRQRSCSDSRTR